MSHAQPLYMLSRCTCSAIMATTAPAASATVPTMNLIILPTSARLVFQAVPIPFQLLSMAWPEPE